MCPYSFNKMFIDLLCAEEGELLIKNNIFIMAEEGVKYSGASDYTKNFIKNLGAVLFCSTIVG